jgi:D-arabinose 1-dehydrogenase-like Zn-dependent alcohol dehydrogenase
MRSQVYAVSSGASKRELALSLGAEGYIDSSTTDVVKAAHALGGARLVVCTAPYADRVSEIIPAITKNGTVMVVAAATDKEVRYSSLFANMHRATIRGWCCGASPDSENCLKFSLQAGTCSANWHEAMLTTASAQA